MKNLREFKSAKERRETLGKFLKVNLSNIGLLTIDGDVAGRRNCENMIGAVYVPVGIAGPLKIKGESVRGDFFIPLATTEGALVASVNRGCKAISQSGGAVVLVEEVGVTRGPVFETGGIRESLCLKKWLEGNFSLLAEVSGKTSSHLNLKKLDVRILGRYVYVRFYFETGEAMGMNMVTIATEKLAQLISNKTGVRCLSLAGNFDIDKKPAWLNFILGRGKSVWAEVILKKEVIGGVLKTTAQRIYEVWLSKCLIGSLISGALGFNAHFANVLTALFIATGQDVAHVGEGSEGITTTQVTNNQDLYVSVYLPDLMVGTVGGGTGLTTQREALSILGIKNGDKKGEALKLAEIVGGAVLAGEVSLLASLAEGSLANAHFRLARGGMESKR